jgi:hypothetical protein
MEWISVKDRLPDEEGNYLVWSNGLNDRDQWSGCYAPFSLFKNIRGGFVPWPDDVTHWMPLPDPPAGQKWGRHS